MVLGIRFHSVILYQSKQSGKKYFTFLPEKNRFQKEVLFWTGRPAWTRRPWTRRPAWTRRPWTPRPGVPASWTPRPYSITIFKSDGYSCGMILLHFRRLLSRVRV